ncbi:MAG: hypothetical protein E5X65_36590, partial [Mesorhizobium sp.]
MSIDTVMDVLRELEAEAVGQKAYFEAKQRKFPALEDFTGDDGSLSLPDDISPLLLHEVANGRYSEADWWLSTIRAKIAALSHEGSAPVAAVPTGLRLADEWSEDDGNVLWWRFPIEEAPYVGSPLDLGHTVEVEVRAHGVEKLMRVNVGGWPGYHTHWHPLPAPLAAP